MLACEFEVAADCDNLLRRLEGLAPRPAQQFPVSRRHRFEARRVDGGGYRLHENGRLREHRPDVDAAVRALLYRMHELTLAALPDFSRLHAGCATWSGRRLVAAGPARSGKSTLMARLLYEGFDVHCDDLLLLRRGEVLPYPRRFFLRRDSVALIPQLVATAADLLEWEGWDPGSLALDPAALGFEWRIDRGPVDAVLFLERDAGREARLAPCPKYAMAERLMFQSTQPSGGPGQWARDVSAMVDRADCFVLRSGHLETSVAAVKHALMAGSW